MKVEKNKVVAVLYELTVDGKIADSCSEESPLEYIHGAGTLLKDFERNLEGLEPGQGFDFRLSAAQGYGEYDENRVIELPKEAFIIDGVFREDLIRVGNVIPLMASNGMVVRGVITAVGGTGVTIDTNHALAGKELSFSGKVLRVRDATERELAEGLHGELVRHGCGGCHGGDGNGCHGGEGEGCGHHGDGEEGCGHHGDGEGCCHEGGNGGCHGGGEGCGHHGDGGCCQK